MATATTSSPTFGVVLSEIDWDMYEKLRGSEGNRNVRMTYNRGILELMSPSKLHERVAEILGRFIIAWTEERTIPVQSCGTVTFKRKTLGRGLEPDKCYYIQNESIVRAKDELDLTIDPPPDLAVEVDVTSSSESRMEIYSSIGVPEIWRWCDDELTVLELSDGEYAERDDSIALPGFPLKKAVELIASRHATDETSLARMFRGFCGVR